MAQIDVVNQRIEDYTDVVEAIKTKVKQIADNKNISVIGGTDTPLSVLTKIDNGTIETPSETISITSNGTVDVTNYASANVAVVDAGFKSFVEGTMTTFRPADYGITKIINAPNNLVTTIDLTNVAEIGKSTELSAYPIWTWDMTTLIINSPNGLKIYNYGIYSCVNVSSFTLDPNTNITALGEYCFVGLGARRSGSNRFTFDFRNSTFTSIPANCFSESGGDYMTYNNMYFPSTVRTIGASAFYNITYTNLFFKNVPTLSATSAKMATSGKYFFLYNDVATARTATNWSNTGIKPYIYGWSEENTFQTGDTLPATDSSGHSITWYSNVGLTTTVTTVADGSKIYYCKVAG